MARVFCCGAECGRAGTVGQHWNFGASASFSTTTVRSGSRSIRINPSAATTGRAGSVDMTASNVWVSRCYVRFATLPSANFAILGTKSTTAQVGGAVFKQSDSKIYAGDVVTPNFGASGVSVTTGVWYRIDVKVDTSANPWTIDVQVDGVACGQATRALAATTYNGIILGTDISVTCDMFFDDISASNTAGDYPLGAAYINHFIPTADGTHNVAGAADFRRGNTTTDITNSTTDAYLLVDDVPLDDTTPDTDDHIRIVAPPNVTDYVECIYGPAPGINTPTVAPITVEVIAEFFAAGTGISDEILKLNDNGTVDNVYNGTQVAGTTTGIYKRKHYATAPTGGAWTVVSGNGNFNNIRFRYGFATDANPDKSLMCTMIEAEFQVIIPISNKIYGINQSVKRASFY